MAAESNAPQRLLIVEDDPHMAYLLGYLAEKERFVVETVDDGRNEWVLDAATQRRAWKASEFSPEFYRTFFLYDNGAAA